MKNFDKKKTAFRWTIFKDQLFFFMYIGNEWEYLWFNKSLIKDSFKLNDFFPNQNLLSTGIESNGRWNNFVWLLCSKPYSVDLSIRKSDSHVHISCFFSSPYPNLKKKTPKSSWMWMTSKISVCQKKCHHQWQRS